MQTILVTGGAGFIGSALIRRLLADTEVRLVNVDALTYAGNLESLPDAPASPRYAFEHADIRDVEAMRRIFARHRPDAVVHLAAESHVDRSIDGPQAFIDTNVAGTGVLLEAARAHWRALAPAARERFRFVHVSTDEVYGDLGAGAPPATERTPYAPSSPYAATKAGSDHLARAWGRTYGLPVLVTHCSNNFGPYQFPEKLIPYMILSALGGERLPVYGDGAQVRDWLYVDDHADALRQVLRRGRPGRTYNIGARNERRNIDIVHRICALMEQLAPEARPAQGGFASLIEHVTDRPGHDTRYALDTTRIEHELGWRPRESFESGLEKTVRWYLDNRQWWQRVLDGSYRLERLGVGDAS